MVGLSWECFRIALALVMVHSWKAWIWILDGALMCKKGCDCQWSLEMNLYDVFFIEVVMWFMYGNGYVVWIDGMKLCINLCMEFELYKNVRWIGT